MSTCLIVQHAATESAFVIADALNTAGVKAETRQSFAGDALPEAVGDFDGLVVMGGPMSATSDDDFPTRTAELSLIADAVNAGIPTFGVCLGAQLLAASCGAPVYPGRLGPEIGWSHVELTGECAKDPLFADLPETIKVLQWHGDTFDLPAGARLLMTGRSYPNQAFRVGEVAWGLQFHIEVTAAAVEAFLEAFGSEAEALPGGMEAIRLDTPAALADLLAPRDVILERFAALIATRFRGKFPSGTSH